MGLGLGPAGLRQAPEGAHRTGQAVGEPGPLVYAHETRFKKLVGPLKGTQLGPAPGAVGPQPHTYAAEEGVGTPKRYKALRPCRTLLTQPLPLNVWRIVRMVNFLCCVVICLRSRDESDVVFSVMSIGVLIG